MKSTNEINEIVRQVDELNAKAWELRVSDSTQSHELGKKALELAEIAGYKKGRAEGLRIVGFGYIRLSEHKTALKCLDEAFSIFSELGEERGLSDIFEYYGIVYRSVGDYARSLDNLYKGLDIRLRTQYRDGESLSYYHLGVTYRYLGNLEKALEFFLKSLTLGRELNFWISTSYSLNNIGSIYLELDDFTNALAYYQQSLKIRKELGDKWGEAGCLDNIGNIHFKLNEPEKARDYCAESLGITASVGDRKGQANSLYHLAEIYHFGRNDSDALQLAEQSLKIRGEIGDKKGQAELYLLLSEISSGQGNDDGSLSYLDLALELGQETGALDLLSHIHQGLYLAYKEREQFALALSHLEQFNRAEKEFHSEKLNKKILHLEISHKVEQSRQEAEIFRLKNVELARLYEEIKLQKEEIEAQKSDLETALLELKNTQTQLIQREKMASLGELTAGIAHEIQNPLNFVNNFSEINSDLLTEFQEAIAASNFGEATSISKEILQNLQRINHHGKRAEAIVKSMLLHSRPGAAIKERRNLNAFIEEYLRLSYHSWRQKNSAFVASLDMNMDSTTGTAALIEQEMATVFLNLFNNAFYSMAEKLKISSNGYEPILTVSSQKNGSVIEIKIRDNGNGIPPKAIDKIFQLFFTTKPTGQGTGLGLSLSYDIITRSHGGELVVNTEEGEFAEFLIRLPIE
jgi:two-component system NtrC family sensor kinase